MQFWTKKLKNLMDGKVLREEARRLGIPVATLKRMVSGDVISPKIEHLVKICNHYKISMDELLGVTELEAENSELAWARSYLQGQAANWLGRGLDDLTDDEIIKVAKYIRDKTESKAQG